MSTATPGSAEIAVSTWWQGVVDAVQRLLAAHDVDIAGIGLSGQMHGVVLVDVQRTALRPAITWADNRAPEIVEEISQRIAPFGPVIANPAVAGMPAVSLRWLQRNEPDLLQRAHLCLQPKDWLGMRLTNEAVTDITDASATLLWDFEQNDWCWPLIQNIGLDPKLFPRISPSEDIRGPLTVAVQSELGLRQPAPVIVGRADTPSAFIGSNVRLSMATQLSIGTGAQICHVSEVMNPDKTLRTNLFCGPKADQWYAMAAIHSAGLTLEWLRKLFRVTWDELYHDAFAAPRGSDGVCFLPYIAGERTPYLDRNMSGAWSGLRLDHERSHLFRAALEGCAFALRDAWEALLDLGYDTCMFTLAGGGTVDARWRRLLADVLQRPLALSPNGGGSPKGAALAAAVAIGWFDDLDQAMSTNGPPVVVAEPSAGGGYEEAFQAFQVLAQAEHERHSASLDGHGTN